MAGGQLILYKPMTNTTQKNGMSVEEEKRQQSGQHAQQSNHSRTTEQQRATSGQHQDSNKTQREGRDGNRKE